MRERIVVTAMGLVSSVAVGREAFYEALATGRSGIVPAGGARTTPSAPVGDFGARQVIDGKALRRMARLAQMGLVAARQALAAAAPTVSPERGGIVLGTGLGTLRETIDFMRGYLDGGPEAASPLLFPSSVMNAAAGQMALELGWRGPNSTVNHRELSGLAPIAMAADLLALGRADAILAGAVEELNEPALHGYGRFGALSTTGMRPYAKDRDGTVLGEGAVVLLLEREADARARGARILVRIAGYASGGSARPRVGWGGGGGERTPTVLRAALDDAQVAAGDVGYVAGGGNGLAVDGLEARALASAFSDAGRAPPVGSILGQTGEWMASAALRVCAAIYALERQALPGTVGAGELAEDCPIDLVRAPRPAHVDAALVPSLSQGGADSALVITRAD